MLNASLTPFSENLPQIHPNLFLETFPFQKIQKGLDVSIVLLKCCYDYYYLKKYADLNIIIIDVLYNLVRPGKADFPWHSTEAAFSFLFFFHRQTFKITLVNDYVLFKRKKMICSFVGDTFHKHSDYVLIQSCI